MVPTMPEVRRGWPLDYIPAGKENWVAFVEQATSDQLEQAMLTLAYDLLCAGRFALAEEALREVLRDRARCGVGGVPQ